MPYQIVAKNSSAFNMVVFISLVFGVIVGKRCVQKYLIESRGVITDGTAVSIVYHKGASSGSYYVYYDFSHNGVIYHGQSRADREWASTAHTPTPIRVRFDPGDPALNSPPDVEGITPLWLSVLFALGLLSFGIYNGMKVVFGLLANPTQQNL